ncbi:MAG: HNH endonuclease [Clostridia bacterium]|jgi:hypothetical protein|nr:HNH endonuclease [Clostridia bacterium]
MKYPNKIQDFIKGNCKGVGSNKMTELLNKSFGTSYTKSQINAYYSNHHINSGLTGRYQKGHVPANKGMKGFYAQGSEKGWFKSGHAPINHKPVGSERVDKDGYTLIKIAEPSVWKQKHKLIWEERNGPVPKGHVLTFLDGNKENITLENLALITMAESLELTRSKLRSKNSEFTKTGILIVKVKTIGNKRKKEGVKP